MKVKLPGVILLGLAASLIAQQPKTPEGARELFYVPVPKKEALPPIRKVAAKSPSKSAPAAPAAIVHLGLRYNVALVDSANRLQPVDAEQTFRKGQCLVLQIEANRAGYLYVLSRQSSGAWKPVLPSAEMPGESNIVNANEKVRVPRDYCIEIADPPGSETFFVVLSRDPDDVYELNEGIKAPVLVASARKVNDEVERFSRAIQSTDLVKNKVAQPKSTGETPNSFYVVNRSDKPASRVVTEIRIRHN